MWKHQMMNSLSYWAATVQFLAYIICFIHSVVELTSFLHHVVVNLCNVLHMIGVHVCSVHQSLMNSWSIACIAEASSIPYAWEHRPLKRLRSNAKVIPNVIPGLEHLPLETEAGPCETPLGKASTQPCLWEDRYLQFPDLRHLPRSENVFRKIEMDPCLSLALPKPGATPGKVLNHAIQFFERLLSKNQPMTFKFGFTHDAAVRWHNGVFGYKFSKDRFDFMVILFGAANPHGPAFLEAALIEKFGSFLFAILFLIVLLNRFDCLSCLLFDLFGFCFSVACVLLVFVKQFLLRLPGVQKWTMWRWYSAWSWGAVSDICSVQII